MTDKPPSTPVAYSPYRVVLCLGCRSEWQVPASSPSPGHAYDLIGCHCPIGSEPEFIWADEWAPDAPLSADSAQEAPHE